MSVKALTKEEVIKLKTIPDIIIKAVNDLLVEKYDKNVHRAIIKQSEILDKVVGDPDCGMLTRESVFRNKYLDFEDEYRTIGWKVTYNKPAYCETYEPFFIFE